MKIMKTEKFEVGRVSTSLGEITESVGDRGSRLTIHLKGCMLTITENEIRIDFHVYRPCHDHDDRSTMIIKGLSFVSCECGRHQESRPVIIFKDYRRPEIANVEELLDSALWGLEKKYGKLYGKADLRAISRVLTDSKDKDAGELVIHAYKNEDPTRHPRCVDIVASPENLAILLPMLRFEEEKEHSIFQLPRDVSSEKQRE